MAKGVILCVDDEKIILNSIKTQLKDAFGKRYLYETAENAKDAEDIIDELFDEGAEIIVIVSDWLMPETKGDEFLIRIHKKYPGIIKIMLSGQADKEAIQRAFEQANLLKCIQKPWSENELIDAINSGLSMLNMNKQSIQQ